jgi:hypothetical protein
MFRRFIQLNGVTKGKRGYEDTGPNAIAIGIEVMTLREFRERAENLHRQMQLPGCRWGALGIVGWPSLHLGPGSSPGLSSRLNEVLARHVAKIDRLDLQAAGRAGTPAASEDQTVENLHNLLAGVTPSDWEVLPIRKGKVTPPHWAAGEGIEIMLQSREAGPKGRASIGVWIMDQGYDVVNPSGGPYQRPGAREVRRWAGRRVFAGTDLPQPWLDWKQMDVLLDKAFKTAPEPGSGGATQPLLPGSAATIEETVRGG